MGTANNRIAHKHFRLNAAKIKLAKKFMRARTETETIERALDAVIAEYQRDQITREANEHLVGTGIKIRDIYGKLAD